MKTLYQIILFACLLLAFKQPAKSQTVTVYPPYLAPNLQLGSENFQIGNVSVMYGGTVQVPATGTINPQFTLTLYRTISSTEEGYVEIYVGDENGNISSAAFTGSKVKTNPLNWAADPSSASYTKQTVFGNVALSALTVTSTRLYAKYYNTTSATNPSAQGQTLGLAVRVGTSTPAPTPTPGPTTPPFALSNYLPCGPDLIICSDQCVGYGAFVLPVQGRILADDGSADFNTYYRTVGSKDAFASGMEHEWAQWQYSYNNVNWTDISGATQAAYSPNTVTVTTYYRRKSTHLRYPLFASNYREDWYISNTVTITPGAATPVPVQSTFATCNLASPATVAINPAANAVSYNWSAADPAVSINGQGPSLSNTANQSVQITLPSSATTGTQYTIYVSANNSCGGGKSSDATLYVTFSTGGSINVPSGARWIRTGSTCPYLYNLKMPAVPGANSYSAVDSNGSSAIGMVDLATQTVTFALYEVGPQTGITATVTATGPCGSASSNVAAATLAGAPGGRACRSAQTAEQTIYPNPATDQVNIATDGQAARVMFYDAAGTPRKTLQLREGAVENAINVRDLPAGLYHVQVLIDGQVPIDKQILIQP